MQNFKLLNRKLYLQNSNEVHKEKCEVQTSEPCSGIDINNDMYNRVLRDKSECLSSYCKFTERVHIKSLLLWISYGSIY